MTALVSPVSWFLPSSNGYKFVPCLTAGTTKGVMAFKYVPPLSLSLRDVWGDTGATGLAGAAQLRYWLLGMAVPRELWQGRVLCHRGRWPLWCHSHLILQQASALALLDSVFLLFLPSPWSHRSSGSTGAARSLSDGRQGSLPQAAPSILGWGTGDPGVICPLSLCIVPSRDQEEMRVASSHLLL